MIRRARKRSEDVLNEPVVGADENSSTGRVRLGDRMDRIGFVVSCGGGMPRKLLHNIYSTRKVVRLHQIEALHDL